MNPTVPDGVTVKVWHLRRAIVRPGFTYFNTKANLKRMNLAPLPKGGITEVQLEADGVVVATGRAVCSSLDNYCRRLGRTIALGRALKDLARNP